MPDTIEVKRHVRISITRLDRKMFYYFTSLWRTPLLFGGIALCSIEQSIIRIEKLKTKYFDNDAQSILTLVARRLSHEMSRAHKFTIKLQSNVYRQDKITITVVITTIRPSKYVYVVCSQIFRRAILNRST